MTTLKTERLTLRPLVPADAEAYATMRFHPQVVKWLPPASGDPVGMGRTTIERFAVGLQTRRYGPWGVFLEEMLIGHGGLHYVPEFSQTEVMWSLRPPPLGPRYATQR